MKFLMWVGKMAMAAVFVSIVAIFAAWTAVHTYLDKLLDQYQLRNGMQQIEFSEFLSELTSGLNIIKQPSPKKDDHGLSGSGETQSSTGAGMKPDGTGPSGKGDDGGKMPGEAPKGGNAVPVWNQSRNSASSANDQRKKVMMSTEDLQKLKENISSEDKMKIFTLLSTRLPQDEIQAISELVEGGITEEKLSKIQSILEKYLKPNEYQQLLDILNKY